MQNTSIQHTKAEAEVGWRTLHCSDAPPLPCDATSPHAWWVKRASCVSLESCAGGGGCGELLVDQRDAGYHEDVRRSDHEQERGWDPGTNDENVELWEAPEILPESSRRGSCQHRSGTSSSGNACAHAMAQSMSGTCTCTCRDRDRIADHRRLASCS
jgi:hypothetical protein